MEEELVKTLSILGPYSNYEVFSGTASDTESEPFDLPDGVKRIDIAVINNPLYVRFYIRGKGGSKQIGIPANQIYTVYASPDRFTVQNAITGSNATYSITVWM